jgi:hypothetical protein
MNNFLSICLLIRVDKLLYYHSIDRGQINLPYGKGGNTWENPKQGSFAASGFEDLLSKLRRLFEPLR